MNHWKHIARLTFLSAVLLLTSCNRANLPVFGTVKRFSLTNSFSETFKSTSMQGKVWLSASFFTRCPGPCLLLLGRMKELVDNFPGLEAVAVTSDSTYDTAEVLKAYQFSKNLIPPRWHLLTGDKPAVDTVIESSFQLGLGEDAETHSLRIVLIDRNMQIRGSFDSRDEVALSNLRKGV
ncbi:MAG: SCO family protein, partial [bacterium]|nr:SCO family protein [bacterium]